MSQYFQISCWFTIAMADIEDWMGCRVSLDCGSLGYFQGVISRISYNDQTVTLEKPFQNGLACKFPEITINSTDITVTVISRPLLLQNSMLSPPGSQDTEEQRGSESGGGR